MILTKISLCSALLLMLFASAAISSDAASPPAPPAAFMQQLVQGINARDLEALRGLIHPKTRQCMTVDNADYYAWRLWKDGSRRYFIPAGYQVQLGAPLQMPLLKPEIPPPAEAAMRWPLQPEGTLSISYRPAPHAAVTRQFEITRSAGAAYLVLDCPTPLGLAAFHKKQLEDAKTQKKLARLWRSLPADTQEAFTLMATSGKKLDGMRAAEQKFHLNSEESLAFMDRIQYADFP